MKEIIYLDTKLVNSLLAQIDQGLILKHIAEESNSQATHEETSNQESYSAGGRLGAGLFSGNVSNTEITADKTALVYSSGNRELVETAIDDFSLDLLLDKIKPDIKTIENVTEGEIVKEINDLTIYDFSMLKNTMDIDSLEIFLPDIVEDYRKAEKELKKISQANKNKHASKIEEIKAAIENSFIFNVSRINKMSQYVESLLSDCSILKIGTSLCICEQQNTRIPKSSLALLNASKRKATILGIAAAEIETDMEFLNFGGSPSRILSHGPSMFINMVTNSFDITKEGDRFVRPIAIYFE
nr:MAG TPA: hypothetical protein [Caudoviricetes sp.]